MTKRQIRRLTQRNGYRIVPQARDANTLKRWLFNQPIRTVIDVGANTGTTVTEWLNEFLDVTVHAIEPLPRSYALLDEMRAKCPNRVKTYNLAIGAKIGTVEFRMHPEHPTSSSLLERTQYLAQTQPETKNETLISVDMTTLDALFADGPVRLAPDVLLKLDVQGVETDVIAGARHLLKRVKYVITEISLAPVYVGQSEFNSVHAALTDAGFELRGFLEQCHLPDFSPVYADVLYVNKVVE